MNQPNIIELASRIEADIKRRGLKPGDPYLGQNETKKMLGVGSDSANRALQLLAQRGVLSRGQRRGTFVAEPPVGERAVGLRHVHVVIDEYYLRHERLFSDQQLLGLQQEIPGANIEFNFLPPQEVPQFCESLIQSALGARHQHGFLVVSAPYAVQQVFANSGLPTLIAGSPFPGIRDTPSLDYDHRQGGLLAGDYLKSMGCQEVLLLARRLVTAGENWATDELLMALHDRGYSLSDLRIRSLGTDVDEVRSEVVAAFDRCQGRKLGIIARTRLVAEAALQVANERGLVSERDYAIVAFNVWNLESLAHPPFAAMCFDTTSFERGVQLGRMIREIAAGQTVKSCRTPMRLAVPGSPPLA